MSREHLEWHSRGYLPHCDIPGRIQSLTIRLFDSMPAERREEWEEMMRHGVDDDWDREQRAKIEAYLDAGYGECHLKKPEIADMVEGALLHFDAERYRMLAWVVMPNHVHTVFEMVEGFPLDAVVHTWKSYTSHKANEILGSDGEFWYPDYRDRFVRNEEHLENVIRYIHHNPVNAGLAVRAEDWRWSSARFGARPTTKDFDQRGNY
jgi:REP element-mobilizing transposase RayT